MRLLFHAPNVHTGGGIALMQEVFAAAPKSLKWAQCDARSKASTTFPRHTEVIFIPRTLLGRFIAEWRLMRTASENDRVLTFNGLPPLLPVKAEVVIFLHNRLLIDNTNLENYPLAVQARIILERFWFRRALRKRTSFIVQTPSMADVLRKVVGPKTKIVIAPFAKRRTLDHQLSSERIEPLFDFVYVSNGDTHKNHYTLIKAWALLAEKGIRPSLALTVDKQKYPKLVFEINAHIEAYGLNIDNLGPISFERVQSLYSESRALIFPSKSESLGLPLIEAFGAGLPILAPELDYVRDVVVPHETFDPESARSIARAVMRHVGAPEPVIAISPAEKFLTDVLSCEF